MVHRYQYSERVSHSSAGDLLTGSNQRFSAPSNLELLPKTSWWKLFIDQKYHNKASPYLLFDRQKSKGFHAVMMKAFTTEICSLQRFIDDELDYQSYRRMHAAVTTGVQGLGAIIASGKRGGDKVNITTFPPIYRPGPMALKELMEEGVGIVAFPDNWGIPEARQDREAKCKVILVVTPRQPRGRYQVNYTLEEAPELCNGFFRRYYREQNNAKEAKAEVRAIVRLVRALHVYHFFADGNGRLNTMLLLNKLLIEKGFPPSIITDPAIFGGGFTVEELITDVHKGMLKMLGEIEAHHRLGHLML